MRRIPHRRELFGPGVHRICAVAAAATAREMIRQIRAGLHETPTIELRLDWLRGDSERSALLSWLQAKLRAPHGPSKAFRGATFLATCRRREGGGKLPGGVLQELAWLVRARMAGCVWCDLEVETLRRLKQRSLRKLRLPPHILLSLHDFRRTPKLKSVLREATRRDAAAIKIAAQAETIADSLRLLRVVRAARHRNLVAVPMGEIGLPARILALREGSALAYAPIGPATAPGQVSLHALIHEFRAHELSQRTAIYGVIADPVGHSLSPLFHNTGFVAAKMDAVYLPFLVHDLRDFLRAVPEFGVRGFSVTIPHKQAILRHLDRCEPLAAKIGAVNTVVVERDGSLSGSNTDYLAVLRALETKIRVAGSRVLLFGAGGAARGAAFALADSGADVFICARRPNAARELARATGGEAIPRRFLRSTSFDAIINTTPVGMHPHEGASPLSARELHCRVVLDMINRPQKTELLQLAARQAIATIPGIAMFFAQGTAQWELWTSRRAPEPAMRRAVLRFLRAEENSVKKR
jgi:3-dehydroquinate dehydratase/shikimate dehydrogenase